MSSGLFLPSSLRAAASGERSCADCVYHAQEDREHFCRRYPPQASILMVPAPPPRVGQVMPQPFCTYPLIDPRHPCGEYKVRAD